MHTPEVFYVRQLLWDEVRKAVNQAEIEELYQVLGHQYIDENLTLQTELRALVEILGDYQKANDSIRDAIRNRPALPEPPGRALLIDELKILASNLQDRQLTSPHDKQILGYIFSESHDEQQSNPPMTPRLKGFESFSDNAVLIRPGTADGNRKRPMSRPPSSRGLSSRGSVTSTASAPAVLEDLGCVNIRQIDSMKQKLRDALLEEKQQLLDDIEFIQGCLEMEQDLIEEDTKHAVLQPAPSLKDLHEFRKALEHACLEHDKLAYVQERIAKADDMILHRRKSVGPLDVPSRTTFTPAPPKRGSSKVHQVRDVVQMARDEIFFS
ncbi:hypothetical protein AeNC1_002726 [Aphanomyces euteiches]|nr:hypothetical protein AeNC1_002726 [Aphanomyces euteiches]